MPLDFRFVIYGGKEYTIKGVSKKQSPCTNYVYTQQECVCSVGMYIRELSFFSSRGGAGGNGGDQVNIID